MLVVLFEIVMFVQCVHNINMDGSKRQYYQCAFLLYELTLRKDPFASTKAKSSIVCPNPNGPIHLLDLIASKLSKNV